MDALERRTIAGITCFFGAAYALYALLRHWRFESNAYDLAIFDQAIWHLSRFEAPGSTITDFPNILGDHFYPVIGLFTPLYWILPRPEMLLVAQALLLALSIVPVYLFARDRFEWRTAATFAAAYGFYWGMQRTAEFDVHEMAFAPLVIAWAIRWMDQRRWGLFWIAAASLIAIKEDLIPLIGAFGVYFALQGEWRRGAVLMVSSVAVFLLVVKVVVPSLNDVQHYTYLGAYLEAVKHPWRVPIMLVTPAVKVRTAMLWFLPFGFLSLFSPLTILLAPLVLERLLSDNPAHWGTIFHYSAPIAPIIAMAAADGLARLQRKYHLHAETLNWIAGGCVLLSSILPGHLPLWQLFDPASYQLFERQTNVRFALSIIPADASVIAQSSIAPHLSQRARIYMLDAHAPDADFVVAHAGLNAWPASNAGELRDLLQERRTRGYRVVFENAGWTILRRSTASGPGPP